MAQLNSLFQPLRIGRMEIGNRIMMPGMAAGMQVDENCSPTPEMVAYYVERARTRPGMMAIGASSVVPPGMKLPHPLALYDDSHIAPLAHFVSAIHEHDTKIGIQLWEGGMQAGGNPLLAPSGIEVNAKAIMDTAHFQPEIKVLTTADVKQVIGHFVAGAERCVKAGFDFVEIHAGHGYLISAFMTPHFNRRTDQYGGNFENRVRFLMEILAEVKGKVGHRIAVGVKLNGDDFIGKDGWVLEDACRVAPMLEEAGADYLSLTAAVMGASRLTIPPLYEKQGCFSHFAAAVKQHVSIPVAAIGRIKNPQMADDLVREGQADIVCMGRAMIADSEVVEKARAGDLADIRPCLAECRGCIDQQMRTARSGERISCSCVVNPRVQRELTCVDVRDEKKDHARTVLIAGGGISGLEAARRCAFSGHKVVLCESRDRLGGQLRFAAMVPGRHEIGDIIPWYERQIEKLAVEVRLGTSVDGALIDSIKPDVVIVATGSAPEIPEDVMTILAGTSGIAVMTADEIFEDGREAGDNVLVLGGDQIGMQLADFLASAGKSVHVAQRGRHFAAKLAANDRWYLMSRLAERGVARVKNVEALEVEPGDAVWLRTGEGRKNLPGIDTIILAEDRRSMRGVSEIARGRGIETFLIGDAHDIVSEDSGTIFSNIAHAYDVARAI